MHHQARPQGHYVIRAAALLLFCAGAAAPAERLLPFDESTLRQVLKHHAGKVVLINFWATWCEPCRAEMPFLSWLASRLRNRGFVLLTVSADEPEQEADARAFLLENRIRMPAYLKAVDDNDRFIGSIDAKWSGALPASFLFDRKGKRVEAFIGETEPARIEAAVRKLL